MAPKRTTLPAHRIGTLSTGTRARSDAELVRSWADSLRSAHSRRNFEKTALRFLDALPAGIRKATVEDVREALAKITEGLSDATAQQYVLRVKSLLSYGHKLGYMPFNAGVTIKMRPDQCQGPACQADHARGRREAAHQGRAVAPGPGDARDAVRGRPAHLRARGAVLGRRDRARAGCSSR